MKVKIVVETRSTLGIGVLYDQVEDVSNIEDAFDLAIRAAIAYHPQPEGCRLRTIFDIYDID